MKTSFALLAGCLVFSSTVFAAPDGYVDPITFDGSDAQKTQVINFIKKHSQADYNEEMIAEMDKCAAKEAAGGDDDDGDSALDTK